MERRFESRLNVGMYFKEENGMENVCKKIFALNEMEEVKIDFIIAVDTKHSFPAGCDTKNFILSDGLEVVEDYVKNHNIDHVYAAGCFCGSRFVFGYKKKSGEYYITTKKIDQVDMDILVKKVGLA